MLYCSSTAFTHGYLGVLNLDSDVLDRNFHQSLYQGMLLNLELLMFGPFIAIVYYLTKPSYKVILSNLIKKDFGNGRAIVKLKKTFSLKTRKDNHIEKKYKPAIKTSVLSMLIVAIFLYSVIGAENKGRDAAYKMKSTIESKEFHVVKFGKNNSDNIAHIYCGSRNCAGFDTATNEVVYFPQNGHRIKRFSATEM